MKEDPLLELLLVSLEDDHVLPKEGWRSHVNNASYNVRLTKQIVHQNKILLEKMSTFFEK